MSSARILKSPFRVAPLIVGGLLVCIAFLVLYFFHRANSQSRLILEDGPVRSGQSLPSAAPEEPGLNQSKTTNLAEQPQPPEEIRLIVTVEEMPGISNPKSFWEGSYEIRVADWNTVVEKTKSGGLQETGLVISRQSFSKRTLIEKDNRDARISIPVKGPLLQRLQTNNPQAFLLRSTVRVFDAQLDQNFAIELNRVWEAKLFPDGEATITIKIEPDGDYSVWGPLPKKLPAGYTIVGPPQPTTKP
jgi:hypothetical protein